MNKELAKQLVTVRKAVKQKFQSLKSDVAKTQAQLKQTYQPITQPLQQLITTISKTEDFIPKVEAKEEESPYESTPKRPKKSIKTSPHLPLFETSLIEKTPKQRTGKTPLLPTEVPFLETDVISESRISDEDTLQDRSITEILEQTRQAVEQYVNTPSYQTYLEDFHELPRKYIDEGVRDTQNKFDHHYGIIHDLETDKLYLGLTLKPVNLIGKDVRVEGITYPGTPGLYELLFKKEPISYKKDDLDNYMDILKRTNAYRKNYDANEQIIGNNSTKYTTIIGPYLQRAGITKVKKISATRPQYRITRQTNKKGGRLLLKSFKKNTDYVYWDNVNELVDRLRLLVASMIAGNTGHENELVSIVDELREAKIIA